MQESLDQRVAAFAKLGEVLGILADQESWPGYGSGLSEEEFKVFQELIRTHFHFNGWFTPKNVRQAMKAWSEALNAEDLNTWVQQYGFPAKNDNPQVIAIICAGNIPMVGFHDVLSVLLTGNKALIKLSSTDNKLIPAVLQLLTQFSPGFAGSFGFVSGKLEGYDAVIATGSNNTSRYFHYYFKDVPHIIRKSRTSVAIIDGNETTEELAALGNDIFDYFGLGCRNISKMYVPKDYDLDKFFTAIYPFHDVVNHNKYANNYDYNKAVWLLNQENLLDNGFILLKEEKSIASPTASLYYEYYSDRKEIRLQLSDRADELQCIVSREDIPFGEAQCPMLWDYADGVDTLSFLASLGSGISGK